MSLPELENLVRIGQLKAEPRNVQEAVRMLVMARTRLNDATLNNVVAGRPLYQRLQRRSCRRAGGTALARLPQ